METSDYGGALEELYDRVVARGAARPIEPEWTVFAEIELSRRSGERRYLDAIARAVRARLDDYTANGIVPGRLTGFKLPVRIGYAARLLVGEGALDGGELDRLREYLVDLLFHAEYERGAMNRAVGFMAALHPILDVVRDHPRLADLRRLEEMLLCDWTARWEPVEDAYGYEAITLLFVLMWFEESGRDELVRSAPMAASLERLLATRSNDGSGVVFGDWRPTDRVPGHYLAIFERAAALLGDGRYRWVADRLWRTWRGRLDRGAEAGPESLFGLAFAARWADSRVEPVPPSTGSTVVRRAGHEPNKLIVRHGWEPDALFAMTSLAHGHEHSHNDALALNAIMRGGVTFLSDNGRNRPEQRAHNLLASADDTVALRADPAGLPRHEWLTLRFSADAPRGWGHFSRDASIPLEPRHFVPNNIPPEFDYDPDTQSAICFGVTGSGRCELLVQEMALAGSVGRLDLLADHGPGARGWVGGGPDADGTARFELDLDAQTPYAATEGFAVAHAGRLLPFRLDLATDGYDWLELTLRIDGGGGDTDIHFVCIGDRECVPKKWKPADSPQGTAAVERFAAGADRTRALLSLDDVTPSGRARSRTREIVAFGQRAIGVRDTIAYGDRKPFAAAQLWHSRRKPEEVGEGWYLIGDEAPLLVGFLVPRQVGGADGEGAAAGDAPRSGGVSWTRSDDPERHNPYTLSCARVAGGERRERFDALLVAPLSGEDPRGLLSSVSAEIGADGRVRLVVAGDSAWLGEAPPGATPAPR